LASVAVLHPRCLCADALATALMVLGPEAGPDYARRRGLAARFVLDGTAGPRERVTPEFAAMVA
jgi:thiamine biosynthesis lipoprotein